MKNIIYLLILTIGFVSCKKESIEPTPQQSVTTPPPNPNDTTGNGGNTNDTVGKVKILGTIYLFNLNVFILPANIRLLELFTK